MKRIRIDPETSDLLPVPHGGRIAAALDRLRTAALTLDVAARTDRRAVRAARAVFSSALGDALRYVRRGVALAEIGMDGHEPEVGAFFLILKLDEAAVDFTRAAKNSLARLRARDGRRS